MEKEMSVAQSVALRFAAVLIVTLLAFFVSAPAARAASMDGFTQGAEALGLLTESSTNPTECAQMFGTDDTGFSMTSDDVTGCVVAADNMANPTIGAIFMASTTSGATHVAHYMSTAEANPQVTVLGYNAWRLTSSGTTMDVYVEGTDILMAFYMDASDADTVTRLAQASGFSAAGAQDAASSPSTSSATASPSSSGATSADSSDSAQTSPSASSGNEKWYVAFLVVAGVAVLVLVGLAIWSARRHGKDSQPAVIYVMGGAPGVQAVPRAAGVQSVPRAAGVPGAAGVQTMGSPRVGFPVMMPSGRPAIAVPVSSPQAFGQPAVSALSAPTMGVPAAPAFGGSTMPPASQPDSYAAFRPSQTVVDPYSADQSAQWGGYVQAAAPSYAFDAPAAPTAGFEAQEQAPLFDTQTGEPLAGAAVPSAAVPVSRVPPAAPAPGYDVYTSATNPYQPSA
ncbi:MAG: hypothetical protein Q4G29_02285 [Pseudoscardovia radai]|nr:hypothetical protein [Pseudoscardovia radai]